MFGKFFNTTHVDTFATQVVELFIKLAPPALFADTSGKAMKKRDKLDEQVRRQTQQFAREHRLNIYQKARLGSQLQDALETAGYPVEFCKAYSIEVAKLIAMP